MGLRPAPEGRGRGDGAVRKMSAIYNESNSYAAHWLRNLVDAGCIAPGTVSAKSILDLEGRELAGFGQAHFFAGVGVWSAALRAGGWPDKRSVWTGSCPCQPFSAAGKGCGFVDERHLWPAWFWLIEQHRPDVLFGEQVESPAGRAWLDLVFTDLEGIGYSCGATVFPAAGVGAPHGRHRILFVADAAEARRRTWCGKQENPQSARIARGLRLTQRSDFNFWSDADWICAGGKWRPIKPGAQPLAHGIKSRVGRLRAYGNAIVLQQAQAFVESFLELEALSV